MTIASSTYRPANPDVFVSFFVSSLFAPDESMGAVDSSKSSQSIRVDMLVVQWSLVLTQTSRKRMVLNAGGWIGAFVSIAGFGLVTWLWFWGDIVADPDNQGSLVAQLFIATLLAGTAGGNFLWSVAFHGKRLIRPRCPSCRRFLRTDKAKQCFKCGANWH